MANNKILIDISSTTGLEPVPTVSGDAGEMMVNVRDRRIFIRNSSGTSVAVSQMIDNHDPTRAYATGEICISSLKIYRCNADIPAKAFSLADWTEISPAAGVGSTAILKDPPVPDHNIVDLAGDPTAFGLRILPDVSQTEDLFQIGPTGADGSYRARVDRYGVPSSIWGGSYTVSQVAHPFSARGQAVAFVGGQYILAASGSNGKKIVGLVEDIISANVFVLRTSGRIVGLQAAAFSGAVIAAEQTYYPSSSVAGQLTSTKPNVDDASPVLFTTSATEGIVAAKPGAFVERDGDTMTGGLSFGNQFVTVATDLTRHLDLKGGVYGISVVSNSLNIVAPASAVITLNRRTEVSGRLVVYGTIENDFNLLTAGANGGPVELGHGGTNAFLRNYGPGDIFFRDPANTDVASVAIDPAADKAFAHTLLTRDKADYRFLKLSGGDLTGGLGFGATAVANREDLSRHLDLFNGTRGLSISANALNIVIDAFDDAYITRGATVIARTEGSGTANSFDVTLQTRQKADGRYVRLTRAVAAGSGLSGGGDLSADRTLSVDRTTVDSWYAARGLILTAGAGLTGGGDLSADRTISHADTSAIPNSTNSGGTVLQSMTFDTYGHALTRTTTNLDTRYARLANVLTFAAGAQWVNFPGRLMDQNYWNPSPTYMMQFSVCVTNFPGDAWDVEIQDSSGNWVNVARFTGDGANSYCGTVPPNRGYRVTTRTGTPTLSFWKEMN